jgi:hypothetical protein
MAGGKDFKQSSAEILSELLSDERIKRGVEYVRGEEFRSSLRKEATERLKKVRENLGTRRRTPEEAAREREISLRLAEVEAEAAELRMRLSDLLKEEERLRSELEDI